MYIPHSLDKTQANEIHYVMGHNNNMLLDMLPVIIVVASAFMLTIALYTTSIICQQEQLQKKGWQILFALVLFFIIGYLAIAYLFFQDPNTPHKFLISMLLFAGSIFVILVTTMSHRSISEVKQLALKERKRARHDQLTNLPNRTVLYERIKQAIKISDQSTKPTAILLMDLDRFKEINDTLGHHYGDALLKLVAPRLLNAVRKTDTVCRLGGDEFAVVLPGAGIAQASNISLTIATQMEQSFLINGHSLNVGISIGISLYPEHGNNSETLMKCADIAMYIAKRANIYYEVYDQAKDKHTVNRLALTGEILSAIQNNQFILHYQPIINIKNRQVRGVEALIRWQHPEHGIIYPHDFIELAEQSGLIKPLTHWVLESAIQQAAQWQIEGLDFSVSVNLSTKNLQDAHLSEQIYQTLKKWKVSPNKLRLEITESSMMQNPTHAFEVILKLHALGIHLSIDDFGTGYSSLSYLKQIPTSELKIDKSFVMDMLHDENDAIIVRSTIDLAHNMGRTVLAEGVENKDILDLLEILRCDHAQGIYICKPLPADELPHWLKQSSWKMPNESSQVLSN